jgi:hypothetical protein
MEMRAPFRAGWLGLAMNSLIPGLGSGLLLPLPWWCPEASVTAIFLAGIVLVDGVLRKTGAGFRIAPEKPRPNVNYTLPVAALCPRPPEIFLKQQL